MEKKPNKLEASNSARPEISLFHGAAGPDPLLPAAVCLASNHSEVAHSGSRLTLHIQPCCSLLAFVFTESIKQIFWLNCVDPACKASTRGERSNKGIQEGNIW